MNELETGLRDAMTLLSTLGDRVRFLEAVVEVRAGMRAILHGTSFYYRPLEPKSLYAYTQTCHLKQESQCATSLLAAARVPLCTAVTWTDALKLSFQTSRHDLSLALNTEVRHR